MGKAVEESPLGFRKPPLQVVTEPEAPLQVLKASLPRQDQGAPRGGEAEAPADTEIPLPIGYVKGGGSPLGLVGQAAPHLQAVQAYPEPPIGRDPTLVTQARLQTEGKGEGAEGEAEPSAHALACPYGEVGPHLLREGGPSLQASLPKPALVGHLSFEAPRRLGAGRTPSRKTGSPRYSRRPERLKTRSSSLASRPPPARTSSGLVRRLRAR